MKGGIIFIVFWLICAILAQGIFTGYFWGEFPRLSDEGKLATDKGTGLLLGICFGPIAAFTLYLMTGFNHHGSIYFWQSYDSLQTS